MVMVNINGEERYFDGYIASNLTILKKAVEKNFDGVVYIGGYEGNGKSTFAIQCAAFVDPTFCVDRVCFNFDELKRVVDSSVPGQAVVYDESWKDVNSGARYSQGSQSFIRLLTENRKKRLFIFVVAATFFDINKYLLIHRSRAYIEVYTKGLDRGFFSFYDRDKKKTLYIRGKRDWNMGLVKPNFRGNFSDWMPFDRDEYEAKKDKAIKTTKDTLNKFEEKEIKMIARKMAMGLFFYLKNNRFLKVGANEAAASYFGVNSNTLYKMRDYDVSPPGAADNIELKTSGFDQNNEEGDRLNEE